MRLPTNCPRKVMEARKPACSEVNPNSLISDPSKNVSRATSIWSTSQADANDAEYFALIIGHGQGVSRPGMLI